MPNPLTIPHQHDEPIIEDRMENTAISKTPAHIYGSDDKMNKTGTKYHTRALFCDHSSHSCSGPLFPSETHPIKSRQIQLPH